MTRVRLDWFEATRGFERGRSRLFESVWYLCKIFFFLSAWPWPSSLKVALLRLFGATMGRGIVIKPRVNIHLPWKLTVGDHCWLGEELFILNLEPVVLGRHVCVSQRAFLCTGNHDYRREDFAYRNAPIRVEDGVWIGAQVFVGPGVTIGEEAVVQAASMVGCNLEPAKIYGGHPIRELRSRWS